MKYSQRLINKKHRIKAKKASVKSKTAARLAESKSK